MIIIATLLYQGNYLEILNENSWFTKYNPKYAHKKLIVVNNVQDREYIEYALNEYKERQDIEYFFIEDYEKLAISTFNLDIDRNKTIGYFYIIPYLALALKLETDYVFMVSADCTNTLTFEEDYVLNSIKEIENNPIVFSTSLNWGPKGFSMGYDVGEWEQINTYKYKNKEEANNDKFWYTVGFSDQVFIVSKKNLMNVDYNLDPNFVRELNSPICQGTPYCPESWERRVSEYLYKNNMYRGVWKNNNHYYIHGK